MSCISIDVRFTNLGSASILPSFHSANIDTEYQAPMNTIIYYIGGNADTKAVPNEPMDVEIALVCSVNSGNYIYVVPTGTMWVTVDESIDYNILSNTDWRIE